MKRLITFILLTLFITPIFSEEVSITIGTEEYVQTMPETISGLKDLVRSLADMYNELNSDYQILQTYSKDALGNIELQLTQALGQLDTVSKEVDKVNIITQESVDLLKKEIDSTDFSRDRFGLSFGAGTSIPFNLTTVSTQATVNLGGTYFTTLGATAVYDIDNSSLYPVIQIGVGSWLF